MVKEETYLALYSLANRAANPLIYKGNQIAVIVMDGKPLATKAVRMRS